MGRKVGEDLCDPLETRAVRRGDYSRQSATEMRMTGGSSDVPKSGYLLPLQEWPAASRGMSAGARDKDKVVNVRREVGGSDLCDPLETGQRERRRGSRRSAAELGVGFGRAEREVKICS